MGLPQFTITREGSMRSRIFLAIAAIAAIAAVSAPAAFANHSWNGYHWARTSNPFTVKLGDNVSGLWDDMLATASSDCSKSTVLGQAPHSATPRFRRPISPAVAGGAGNRGPNSPAASEIA